MPVSATLKWRFSSLSVREIISTLTTILALWRELDRVADEIYQDLAKPTGITNNRLGYLRVDLVRQLKIFCASPKSQNLHDFSNRVLQAEFNRLEIQLPRLDFEKSRMSLITPSSESPDDFSIPRYSRCSGANSVFSTRSVMPSIPFKGVRISWLMLARNSPLTRLASSAFCLAWITVVGFKQVGGALEQFNSNSMPFRDQRTHDQANGGNHEHQQARFRLHVRQRIDVQRHHDPEIQCQQTSNDSANPLPQRNPDDRDKNQVEQLPGEDSEHQPKQGNDCTELGSSLQKRPDVGRLLAWVFFLRGSTISGKSSFRISGKT